MCVYIYYPFITVGWLGRGFMRCESVDTFWALMPILAQGPTFGFPPGGSMALRPVDWTAWKGAAKLWLTTHQRFNYREASRAERLESFELRAAFAVASAADHREDRRLGALPCDRCGLWTHCWCEACSRPATAICTVCDAAEAICHACERAGKSWRSARAAYEAATSQEAEEIVEVSRFHDAAGVFQTIDPPLRIPLQEVLQANGELDATAITRRASAHGSRGDGRYGA